MNEESTRKVLIDARNAIAKPEKWVQGAFHQDGGHCALGALEVGLTLNNAPAVRKDAALALSAALPKGYHIYQRAENNIMCFNDNTDTSHADVLKLFDKAICELEK